MKRKRKKKNNRTLDSYKSERICGCGNKYLGGNNSKYCLDCKKV